MSNGCVLGKTCNKPIRVSSTIPFKSQLHSRNAIYTTKFTERISREEAELLVREQIGNLIMIQAMTIHYDM